VRPDPEVERLVRVPGRQREKRQSRQTHYFTFKSVKARLTDHCLHYDGLTCFLPYSQDFAKISFPNKSSFRTTNDGLLNNVRYGVMDPHRRGSLP
jgi:hypothetical protein